MYRKILCFLLLFCLSVSLVGCVNAEPETIIQYVEVEKIVEVPIEVIVEKEVIQEIIIEKEVIVEVTKEVVVEIGKTVNPLTISMLYDAKVGDVFENVIFKYNNKYIVCWDNNQWIAFKITGLFDIYNAPTDNSEIYIGTIKITPASYGEIPNIEFVEYKNIAEYLLN